MQTDMRTDRPSDKRADMTKLIGDFRNSAKAPNRRRKTNNKLYKTVSNCILLRTVSGQYLRLSSFVVERRTAEISLPKKPTCYKILQNVEQNLKLDAFFDFEK